ncbi:hypothetical protein HBI07_247270 [Parastagonospora nodorum]|nr:hypothetical protein HBI07_247270 [Parastagonospora nodorum]
MPAPYRQLRYFYHLTKCDEPNCHYKARLNSSNWPSQLSHPSGHRTCVARSISGFRKAFRRTSYWYSSRLKAAARAIKHRNIFAASAAHVSPISASIDSDALAARPSCSSG